MAEQNSDNLRAALRDAYPELRAVAEAASDPVYVVGGTVRDLLLGRPRSDLDLVVVGDPAALGRALGGELVEHDRFATAKVRGNGGHEIDLATARTEAYQAPGSLPTVAPAGDIEADLARRDFTVNAMALPLNGGGELIDPFGGRADLEARLLRVLHPRSFVDDPTRAIRAARYAARLGLSLEPETEKLLRAADLSTVSEDRRTVELLRLAGEPRPGRGFELLAEWGLLAPRPGGPALADAAAALLDSPPWEGIAPRRATVLFAALGPPGPEQNAAQARPQRPSEAVETAAALTAEELAIARALGAEWLDRYLLEWRDVVLEIDGEDLIAAGVPEGPAVGAGLRSALRRKLDGEVDGRERELEAALEALEGDALGQ